MATSKSMVNAYINPELREKIKIICEKEKRSESNMIEYLIDKYIRIRN